MRGYFYLLLSLLAVPALAHGGEDHGAPAGTQAAASGELSVSAMTARFEAVLRYRPLRGGERFAGTLYLADYATNAPAAGAEIALQVLGITASATVTATDELGVYAVTIPEGFPADGHYDLTLTVRAGEVADLLLLSSLHVGEVEGLDDAGHGDRIPWLLLLGALVFAAAAGAAGFYAGRRAPDQPARPDLSPPTSRRSAPSARERTPLAEPR